MCNTRKLAAIALACCEAVFPPNPQKTKQTPWNDSHRQTIPKRRQKRFLKKLAGEKLRNRKLGLKKKSCERFQQQQLQTN